jgi:hypothetical protein
MEVNQQPMLMQIRRQLEPLLKVELSFVSRAADLNLEERRALIAASVKWFDEFVADFFEQQDQEERQMWLQGMQGVFIGGGRTASNPRESIERGVAQVVTSTLSKEKAAAYERECAKRASFYRDVTVANLVERFDEKLKFSAKQRGSITDSLTENLDRAQIPEVEALMTHTDALPDAAEMWIRPELSEPQRRMLNNMNNLASGQIFFARIEAGGEVIDDIELPAPPEADNAARNLDRNVDIFQP